MGAFDGLAFRVFGFQAGAWFWLANSQSVNQSAGLRWDMKQGSHPWVLVADHGGGPVAQVRPRSAHVKLGIHQPRHPLDCETTCKLNEEGWIPLVRWSVKFDVLAQENFSCSEPDPAIVQKLLSGAAR